MDTPGARDNKAAQDDCQLLGIIRTSPRSKEKGIPPLRRIKRAMKIRLGLGTQKKIKSAINTTSHWLRRGRRKAEMEETPLDSPSPTRLDAGDPVRVRSREEIRATLDFWRSLKGCAFLKEMEVYCGTTQKVLKRVERFMDERDYHLKKASGVVLLEGVLCPGTETTGRCDRSCFFFWREEWLEKLDGPDGP